MGEWYLFAVFVFLLAALLIWFYKRTPRSQKKREEKSFEREAKLFKLYQNIEDLMDGFEEYVEELQSSFRLESGEVKRRVEALETQHAHIRHTLRDLSANAAEPPEAYLEPEEVYAETEEIYIEPEEVYEPAETYERPINQQDGGAEQESVEEKDNSPPVEGWPEGSGWPGEDAPRNLPEPTPGTPLNRAQRVRMLLDEGLDIVRIARELGLSLNEVNLIIQLDERPDASLH